ncbi:hypothetical protein JKP88DRAFT_240656 [Tribonema minus]|uniref:TRAF-type domain-containing protein n=1 Tax=Tribonema minus TaxID=303371 RepID=A0A835ZEJ2_9STRA|nr:hypothetical protein JKP88DRAFT_240656 [Tribonema minus]
MAAPILDWTSLQSSLLEHVDKLLPPTSEPSGTDAAGATRDFFTPRTAPARQRQYETWTNPTSSKMDAILDRLREQQAHLQAMDRAHRQQVEALSLDSRVLQRRVEGLELKLAAHQASASEALAAAQRLETVGMQLTARQDQAEARAAGAAERAADLAQRVLAAEARLHLTLAPAEVQGIVATLLDPARAQLEARIAQVARGIGTLSEGLAASSAAQSDAHRGGGGGGGGGGTGSAVQAALAAADAARLAQRVVQVEARLQAHEAATEQKLAAALERVEAALRRAEEAGGAAAARAAAEARRDMAQLLHARTAESGAQLEAVAAQLEKLRTRAAAWDSLPGALTKVRTDLGNMTEDAHADVISRIQRLAEEADRDRRDARAAAAQLRAAAQDGAEAARRGAEDAARASSLGLAVLQPLPRLQPALCAAAAPALAPRCAHRHPLRCRSSLRPHTLRAAFAERCCSTRCAPWRRPCTARSRRYDRTRQRTRRRQQRQRHLRTPPPPPRTPPAARRAQVPSAVRGLRGSSLRRQAVRLVVVDIPVPGSYSYLAAGMAITLRSFISAAARASGPGAVERRALGRAAFGLQPGATYMAPLNDSDAYSGYGGGGAQGYSRSSGSGGGSGGGLTVDLRRPALGMPEPHPSVSTALSGSLASSPDASPVHVASLRGLARGGGGGDEQPPQQRQAGGAAPPQRAADAAAPPPQQQQQRAAGGSGAPSSVLWEAGQLGSKLAAPAAASAALPVTSRAGGADNRPATAPGYRTGLHPLAAPAQDAHGSSSAPPLPPPQQSPVPAPLLSPTAAAAAAGAAVSASAAASESAQCSFCLRRVLRGDMGAHLQACELRMVPCPRGCGARMLVRNVERHAEACAAGTLPLTQQQQQQRRASDGAADGAAATDACRHCGAATTQRAAHEAACSARPVRCPRCLSALPFCDLPAHVAACGGSGAGSGGAASPPPRPPSGPPPSSSSGGAGHGALPQGGRTVAEVRHWTRKGVAAWVSEELGMPDVASVFLQNRGSAVAAGEVSQRAAAAAAARQLRQPAAVHVCCAAARRRCAEHSCRTVRIDMQGSHCAPALCGAEHVQHRSPCCQLILSVNGAARAQPLLTVLEQCHGSSEGYYMLPPSVQVHTRRRSCGAAQLRGCAAALHAPWRARPRPTTIATNAPVTALRLRRFLMPSSTPRITSDALHACDAAHARSPLRVNGAALLDLTDRDLAHPVEGLGIRDGARRERILACVRAMRDEEEDARHSGGSGGGGGGSASGTETGSERGHESAESGDDDDWEG